MPDAMVKLITKKAKLDFWKSYCECLNKNRKISTQHSIIFFNKARKNFVTSNLLQLMGCCLFQYFLQKLANDFVAATVR